MRTIAFMQDGREKLGVVTNRGVLDVELAAERFDQLKMNPSQPQTVMNLIKGGSAARNALEALTELAIAEQDESVFLQEEEIQYLPSVTNPEKILCVGLNYKNHADGSKMELPEKPIIFSKFKNALCAHQEEISLSDNANQFDYEAELAIVIGKTGKYIEQEDALSYVYGYTIGNDFSARDLQFASSQWLLGKNGDKFCPLGPELVTADEIENPQNLKIKTYINNEIRQDGCTKDMIFPCDEIISYISKHMTLQPGDVILTGTPEGVVMEKEKHEQQWLKSGDNIKIEIERLGKIENNLK
ncbi:fumarylacetoacetate hydrolase family protein [Oceanobacillus longus]|uniref:Fumarylacetoacetate hydrolase family protein n=1 Tax=Oceanobacillus longus TaxID=930120 RepID=A0ABV8GZ85_9BACI